MTVNWEEDPDRPKLKMDWFIERASGQDIDTKDFRRDLAKRLIKISENVECLHGRPCGYHIAEAILRTRHIPGAVVECGCFQGGMSAKMSILCNAIGKRLLIFDSFCGLPYAEDFVGSKGNGHWARGQFSSSVENTKNNIIAYGEISCCRLIKGFFQHTIQAYPSDISFIFIDVDLIESAKTCLRHFWPRLKSDRFYSHEMRISTYRDGILDKAFWEELGHPVPEVVGGYSDAPALGYLKKLS